MTLIAETLSHPQLKMRKTRKLKTLFAINAKIYDIQPTDSKACDPPTKKIRFSRMINSICTKKNPFRLRERKKTLRAISFH